MPDTIKAFLPYTYRISGRARGKRTEIDYLFVDEMPVDVPVLSEAEAPVSFQVRHDDGLLMNRLRAVDGVGFMPLRAPGRMPGANQFAQIGIADLENITRYVSTTQDSFCGWDTYPAGVFERDHLGSLKRPYLRSQIDLKEIGRSNMEEQRAAAAAAFTGRVALVDGALWVAGEHVLKVDRSWDNVANRQRRLTSVDGRPLRLKTSGEAHLFRLDQREQAARYAAYLAEVNDEVVVPMSGEIEDRGLIKWTFDGAPYSAATAIEAVLEKTERSTYFTSLPTAALTAFGEMRDALREAEKDAAPKAGPLMERLRTFLDIATSVSTPATSSAEEWAKLVRRHIWRADNIDVALEPAPAEEDAAALVM